MTVLQSKISNGMGCGGGGVEICALPKVRNCSYDLYTTLSLNMDIYINPITSRNPVSARVRGFSKGDINVSARVRGFSKGDINV